MEPSFSIVIPNLNGTAFLQNCLPSLIKAIQKCPSSKFEIILVDNDSTDDSLNVFEISIPKNIPSKAILLKKNTGFAYAVNQGILSAKHDYVVVTNNDLVIDDSWFKYISQAIIKNKDSKIVCFTGLVLNHDASQVESRGLKFESKGKCTNIDNGKEYDPSMAQKHQSSNALIWGSSAALVAYHRQTIIDIGMLDSIFFAYEEDVDLALRLHHLGLKTLFVPKSFSQHLGGATSSRMGNLRPRMDAKNWFYIIIKNYSAKEILQNLLPITEERLRNLSGLVKQTPIYQVPLDILSTYLQVIINLPYLLDQRHQIQKLKLKYK